MALFSSHTLLQFITHAIIFLCYKAKACTRSSWFQHHFRFYAHLPEFDRVDPTLCFGFQNIHTVLGPVLECSYRP